MSTPAAVNSALLTALLAKQKSYPEVNKPRISTDVLGLLSQINSLQVKNEDFVAPDGRTSNLLQLFGTIPIYYKGGTYHTPVNLWIVENYPNVPPTVFVAPTRDMRIKHRHKHVDAQGMVYLPYLNQWTARSTLAELVSFMSSVFSEDPPCFKAPASTPAPAPAPTYSPPIASPAIQPWGPPYNPPTPAPIVPPLPPPKPPKIDARATRKTELMTEVTTRLQQGLAISLKATAQQIDHLFETQRVLKEGEEKLDRGLTVLKSELSRTRSCVDTVDAKIAELKQWLEENEGKETIDPESAIQFGDSWSKALFEQVALDHAIEDTLYCLDRALAEDRIDLPIFLKEVRKLARKQFFARALSLKIYEKQQEAARAGGGGASASSSFSGSGVGGGPSVLSGAPAGMMGPSSASSSAASAFGPLSASSMHGAGGVGYYRDPGAIGH